MSDAVSNPRFAPLLPSVLMAGFLSSCTVLDDRESIALSEKAVILTFDDGPNGRDDITERVLDILEKHGVQGVFCVIGKEVDRHPELVARAHREGHLLVNHSYNHHFPLFHSSEHTVEEMKQADAAIGRALGDPDYRSRYYRPPNGVLTDAQIVAMREYGIINYYPLSNFAWDVFLGPDKAHIAYDRIVETARKEKGGVFVLHEARATRNYDPDAPVVGSFDRSWVPQAVDKIITTLKAEGFHFPDPEIIFEGSR